MTIRLAAIQPTAGTGRGEERNATDALGRLDKAAASGADLVLFPEGYPGPTNPQNQFDAFGPLAERAARLGVHVIAGRIEPIEDGDGYYVVLHLIDDEGATVGLYRRTTPAGPYVYHDIDAWNFDYVESAGELPLFDTDLGRIGLQVCSEVYSTEQSRLLALKGAESTRRAAASTSSGPRGRQSCGRERSRTWSTPRRSRASTRRASEASG